MVRVLGRPVGDGLRRRLLDRPSIESVVLAVVRSGLALRLNLVRILRRGFGLLPPTQSLNLALDESEFPGVPSGNLFLMLSLRLDGGKLSTQDLGFVRNGLGLGFLLRGRFGLGYGL